MLNNQTYCELFSQEKTDLIYRSNQAEIQLHLFLNRWIIDACRIDKYIEEKPESAYWIYAAVNVFFGLVFAFLLSKGSKSVQN